MDSRESQMDDEMHVERHVKITSGRVQPEYVAMSLSCFRVRMSAQLLRRIKVAWNQFVGVRKNVIKYL